jgi:hypothetical protein
MRNLFIQRVETTVGKKSHGKPNSRLEGNIKIDLKGMGSEDVDWIHLAQCRDKWNPL